MIALELRDLFIENIYFRFDELPHLLTFLAIVYPFFIVLGPYLLDEPTLKCLKFLIHEAVDFFLAVSQLFAYVLRQPLDVASNFDLHKRE